MRNNVKYGQHSSWLVLASMLPFPRKARTPVAKCCGGSYLLEHRAPLQNQAVQVPVTGTRSPEAGPNCLRRSRFDIQMPEGPKGYSRNPPKIS